MLRKIVSAVVVLVLCIGIALADEMFGVITKLDNGKVTFTEMKGKEKGDTHTLAVADNVKVVKGKFNKETKKVEAGDEVEKGLKNEMFTKIGEKGVRVQIVTDGGNKKITEIRVLGGKKKKDNN
jgi:hypothetical protein